MTIIFLLIFVSTVVALGFLGAYLWATKDGQFDDDYTPSVRILFDDTTPSAPLNSSEGTPPETQTSKLPIH